MRPPLTLAARLVIVTVALVALVSALIGTLTTLAMRERLHDSLDRETRAALTNAIRPRGPGGPLEEPADEGRPGGGQGFQPLRGLAAGTLVAVCTPEAGRSRGEVVVPGTETLLNDAQLAQVCGRRGLRTVHVEGIGEYRLATRDIDGRPVEVVAGLPTDDLNETIDTLVWWELGLGAAAMLVAGGLAVVVVRRELRPLREVAATAHEVSELPLAAGDIDLSVRVPQELTDERTEVGRVGAALNSLLSHVETSLGARHRSEQQVRRFVADASHELRTPLATITGYAELARRRPDDVPALRTAMDKVDVESARMSALVEDLLLLARLDAGRPLAREPVDLTLLLLTAVEDAQVLAPSHTWVLELPEESAVEVTGDDLRLHQVITNLLANARRHTPPGTTVTVRAELGDPVVLTVHDNGPGFPEGLVDDAFERFTRGDVARTRAESGAGLGLSLVKAIVGAHGGQVSLRSCPGSTTFIVELPR